MSVGPAFAELADFAATALTPAGIALGAVTPEPEAAGYAGGLVRVGARQLRIRTARLTPKKTGLFVAIWTRRADGSSGPVPGDDPSDGVLLFVAEGEHRGAFLVPGRGPDPLGLRANLDGSGGKRGVRLYPPWSQAESAQAGRSQHAQAPFFVPAGPLDPRTAAWLRTRDR
ncbi:MepB family protein [Leucobacter sp. M11]|nr:MepB family protein [Leucobacter sp. M11]